MLDERVRSADVAHLREADLCNDGTELAGRRRDTMRRTSVASREDFTRYNECCGVRAEVLEEVGETVEEHEGLGGAACGCELVVSEAHDNEEDREEDEAHELDRLAAPSVDEQEGNVVPWDETRDRKDEVSNADVVQILVNFPSTGEVL